MAVIPKKSPSSWPSLSADATNAAKLVMQNKMPDPNRWTVKRHKFFHRVNYAVAGQASLQLFNVAPTDFICNLPVQGSLPAESFFKLTCVRLVPESNITSAADATRGTSVVGTDSVNGAQSIFRTTAQTTNDALPTILEEYRTIFQEGALNLTIGDKKIVDNVYGLHNFPAGSVPTVSGAYGGTYAASTVVQTMLFQNGEPNNTNGWFLTPAMALLPNKQIRGSISWQTALSCADAFVIRVELEGAYMTPANG